MRKPRNSELKPLLLSTTLRNPQRIKDFLGIIVKYDGKILTNDLINNIVKDLIREKKYAPMYISRTQRLKTVFMSERNFTDKQVEEIILHSPQNHKEAGYERGWPSRFETWYMLPKELGFINYAIGEPINVSETGKKLIESSTEENFLLEEKIFTNAFAKYQRINPYSKVLNDNKPLVLLLNLLKYLSKNYVNEFKGISKQELAFVICWSNSDFSRLGDSILEIRKKYGFNPSDDFIYDKCLSELGVGIESSNRFKKENILGEMVDEFIRKMRLTGLITLRGAGRFIDINSLREEDVLYIIANYSKTQKFKDTKDYFSFMSSIDDKFMDDTSLVVALSQQEKVNKFLEWVNYFSFEELKSEILILSNYRSSSKNEILKYIKETIRLEFLTSLILQKKFSDLTVIPNYVSDDEGIPVAHAPGNNADIICEGKTYSTLFEVTLLTGSQQHIRESFSVGRHLKEFSSTNKNAFSVLMAPSIHEDTLNHAEYFKFKEKLDIIPISFTEFNNKIDGINSLESFRI